MDKILVTQQDGNVAVSGAITFETVNSLYVQLLRAIADPRDASLTIDLSNVTRIDSSVIALMTGVQLAACKGGMAVVFTGLNDGIHSLVTLYDVGSIVDPQRMPVDMARSEQ